ncbi:hypothetical protein PP175_25350 (plasmid) [Aneurinibacillus sp. Ricciae_BoGa-3]|uniref:hypothetical protein n=1 Tax=Aneurinibacillus sp. Ricciae_BoGa-3 TaxID=3022697 RepID=UPI002341620B|nr:hypothetical protein [Aneurinibacillus sp. Ricciae_BoGa-3]WCK57396.1 hypothetical protein PP175_25350 [Aneurinibacillus sp. Ricciae_BoGa-3]
MEQRRCNVCGYTEKRKNDATLLPVYFGFNVKRYEDFYINEAVCNICLQNIIQMFDKKEHQGFKSIDPASMMIKLQENNDGDEEQLIVAVPMADINYIQLSLNKEQRKFVESTLGNMSKKANLSNWTDFYATS